MKVAVIGAGAAGLTAAYQLAKGGCAVEVFEAGEAPGGLGRSLRLWDQTVDLGPHRFFSSDTRVNRLWLEVVGRDYAMVNRLTRIYYRRRFFNYPLKPGNALWNLGLLEAGRCLGSYGWQRLRPARADDGSFEDWVTGRFGRRLFQVFFKTYSEKLWGIPCTELDADFAAQRIKKLSLSEAIKNALRMSKGATHKTLVDRFAYPHGGTGQVYAQLARQIEAHGGRVHLKSPVLRATRDGPRITGLELADGSRPSFDQVISTMPLTDLVLGLGDVPDTVRRACESLTYRNTLLVYLHVAGAGLFPDQWLYVHSPDLLVGRVSNFRNWVPQLYGGAPNSVLALEYWAYERDPIWNEPDAALVARAAREMESTGLLRGARVLDGHVVRLARCYPVYRRGYKEQLAAITPWLNGLQGLIAIGRYGAFKYNNQDHSILMGLLAAENLLQHKGHDLWAVNTDYESYQEASVITETGLEAKAEGGTARMKAEG